MGSTVASQLPEGAQDLMHGRQLLCAVLPTIACGLMIAACIMIPRTVNDYNNAQDDLDVTTCVVQYNETFSCGECQKTNDCECEIQWDDFTSTQCDQIPRINKVAVTS